jgi:uncharacterized protein YegL
MQNKRKQRWMCWVGIILALCIGQAGAQVHLSSRVTVASNLIVPQRRAFSVDRRAAVEITGVKVGVVILEQVATTTMDISLRNPTNRRTEAELIVPVPDGVAVRSFTFQGAASEPTAQLIPKEEAKRTYDAIVAKLRDPALLEFIGYNLIRSSVFPVDARGTQKVRLTYEHLLPADGGRVDYVLPRTESLDYGVPWEVSVRVKSKQPISTVYSPSHKLETTRVSENIVSARIAADARTEPGPFRLSYLLESNGVTASLFTYPDPKVGGGYFLMLAGLPARPLRASDGPGIKREVTLVFDRSGSMSGEKIEQVREAAFQILAGLEEGEAFNIIVYNEAVEQFSKRPVMKTEESVKAARAYLKTINARGGTNIHDALLEALRQKPAGDMLSIVLFMTDGLPTVGQTSEVAIRNVAIKANPHNRRIFTFGVGVDVNAPLLDKIATETRATATYVLPKEDVEVKVAQVFKRLVGPVLADAELEVTSARPKWAFTDSATSDHGARLAMSSGFLASPYAPFRLAITREVRIETSSAKEAKVKELFRSVVEGKLQPTYVREEPSQHFEWTDIPILLALAGNEKVVTDMPRRDISSYIGGPGREGMVALWLIEGLRRGQEMMTEKEQRKPKTFPRFSGVWPPLNPICVKEGMKMAECDGSPEIHREVLDAYRKWWDAVKSLSPKEAALFDPLDLSDLTWWGALVDGELEIYDAMAADGTVARRVKKAWRGPVLKTTYYRLDERKLSEGQKGATGREGRLDKSMLALQKVVLHFYDEKGKEIRTEEYPSPRSLLKAVGNGAMRVAGDKATTFVSSSSATAFTRVRDVIPSKLPDLFEGDQLVVLGQYLGEKPLAFEVSGNYLGKERSFQFTFDLENATTRNAFVPRLWASRKIGLLVDAIRQLGGNGDPLEADRDAANDPRLKELVEEVVSLSKEFGVLTEYTAFLAREGTDLTKRNEILAEANGNFVNRAMRDRSGLIGVNQSFNNDFNRRQEVLNLRNGFWDQNMERVSVTSVQQVNDMAFYRRGNRWVDSHLVDKEKDIQPRKEIEFGSEEFRELALRLVEQNRQGAVSLQGDIFLVVDGEPILVKGPGN